MRHRRSSLLLFALLAVYAGHAVAADCTPMTDVIPAQAAYPADLEARLAEGELALEAKDYDKAETLLRPLLDDSRARVGADHQKTLAVEYELGRTLFIHYDAPDAKFAESLAILTDAAQGYERLLGRQPTVGRLWSKLARLRKQGGDTPGALAAAVHASEILDATACPVSQPALDELAFRADLTTSEADALPLYLELYRRDQTFDPRSRATLMTGHYAAALQYRLGQTAASEALLRDLVPRLAASLGEDDDDTLKARRNLAVRLDAQGRHAEAEPLFRAVLESVRRKVGQDDAKALDAEIELAEVLRDMDRKPEAEALYRRVLAVREQAADADPAVLNDLRLNLASLVRSQAERWQEAIDLSQGAYDSCLKTTGPASPQTVHAAHIVAMAYRDAGRFSQAARYYRIALAGEVAQGADADSISDLKVAISDVLSELRQFAEAAQLARDVHDRDVSLKGEADAAALRSAHRLALVLARMGDEAGARALTARGLALAIKTGGTDGDPVLMQEVRLADVLQAARDWPAAEAAWRVVVAHTDKVKGAGSADAGEAHAYLGNMLRQRDRYADAEGEYRQSAAIYAKLRGDDDRSVLNMRGAAALMAGEQGRYDEAIAIRTDILARETRLHGDPSPQVFTERSNLAISLFAAGRQEEGLAHLRQVDDGATAYYGVGSRKALAAARNLASALASNGHLEEGVLLAKSTYEASRLSLGPDAQDTLDARQAVITTLADAGRISDALSEARALLDQESRVLGPDASDTLLTQNNLASLLSTTGDLVQAETLMRRTWIARSRVLGPRHPDTLGSLSNLGGMVTAQDRFAEAEKLQREAVTLLSEVLGPAHPTTLAAQSSLAESIFNQNRPDETVAMQKQTYQTARANLGANHPLTLDLLAIYATNLSRRDPATAEALQADGYKAMRTLYGEESYKTLLLLGNRAVSLGQLGRRDEEEALNRQVYEARSRMLGQTHPDTLAAADNLSVSLEVRRQWAQIATLERGVVDARRRREQADPQERLLTGAIRSRRQLGKARLELANYAGAYEVLREAATSVRRRYGDRRVQSGENATGMLSAYAGIFTEQLRAGWAWAHQP
jgi:hypothetical protein